MISRRLLAIILSFGTPVVILVVGLAAFAIMGALKPKPERSTDPAVGVAVYTAPVVWSGAELTVMAQGEVKPKGSAEISSLVQGQVTYVSPKLVDGGFISTGDVLVRIDDSDYKLALVRARATVAGAQSALALAEAEVAQARADWEQFGQNDPSDLALRLPQLEDARASLQAAQAAVDDAALQLERTVVRAPFDGRITKKSVGLGQYVVPGMSLASAFATKAVEVELLVSGSQIGDIGLSPAFDGTDASDVPDVILSADVGGKRANWIARVTRTGAMIDPSTRLISVYARLDDPFGAGSDDGMPLIPGMFVDATIQGRKVAHARSVPRSALRGRDTLYVAEKTQDERDTVLRMVRVNVIHSTPLRVYFISDLADGDLVIVSPVQAARDGMRVSLIEDQVDDRHGADPAVSDRQG